jgi:hypothetical protein
MRLIVVVVQLWEQLVQDTALSRHAQSLLLAVELTAKVAPAGSLGERLEHLPSGAGRRVRSEEFEVCSRAADSWPIAVTHVHAIVSEIRGECWVLGARGNLLIVRCEVHVARRMRLRVHLDATHAHVHSRVGSVLLKTVSEVVEVCVECKVVGRNGAAESAVVVEEKTRVGSAGRTTAVFAQGRGDREGVHVVEVEIEVHVKMGSKIG